MKISTAPALPDPVLEGPKDLGRVLRVARKEAGLTLEHAAAGLGIAKQTLQDLERGTGTVGLGIAFRVAAELGVTLLTAPAGQKDPILRCLRERT